MAMAVASCVSCKPLKAAVGLDSRRSEISGTSLARVSLVPVFPKLTVHVVQPLASRVCQLTGKKYNKANKVSFSGIKTIKRQQPNLQYKRLWWEKEKKFVRLRICTKALKTIDKKGLDVMAKEAGINLHKLCCKRSVISPKQYQNQGDSTRKDGKKDRKEKKTQ